MKYLRGKRYSKSTIMTYFSFFADFIDFTQPKSIDKLNNRDVEKFIETVFIAKKYSISSQRQFISTLKLFVKYHPNCTIDSLKLERPKKSKILTSVLSQEKIIKLLQVTKNFKHRATIALFYSAGLRIGELINLRLHHIDIQRKQLFIQNAKGRKDRYVVLLKVFCLYLKTI